MIVFPISSTLASFLGCLRSAVTYTKDAIKHLWFCLCQEFRHLSNLHHNGVGTGTEQLPPPYTMTVSETIIPQLYQREILESLQQQYVMERYPTLAPWAQTSGESIYYNVPTGSYFYGVDGMEVPSRLGSKSPTLPSWELTSDSFTSKTSRRKRVRRTSTKKKKSIRR